MVHRIAIFARNPTISKTIPKIIIALQVFSKVVTRSKRPDDLNVLGGWTAIPPGRLRADVASRTDVRRQAKRLPGSPRWLLTRRPTRRDAGPTRSQRSRLCQHRGSEAMMTQFRRRGAMQEPAPIVSATNPALLPQRAHRAGHGRSMRAD